MPNPHFDVKVISRNGRQRSRAKAVASAAYNAGAKVAALAAATAIMHTSVVASAAYRSGEALYDMQAAKTYDYSHKEEVVHTEIMTPENTPPWASDRQFLWNQVESVEKRKDAQLARDLIAALPRELNHAQQVALVRDFVREQFVAHGMIADFAIHDKEAASDGGRQPHVHIMLTLRDITAEGFGKKNRAWNQRTLVTTWRTAWADTTNRHLAMAGRTERLDLRSYAEQGIDKIPGEHMGPDAWHVEQQGTETAIGDRNRIIDYHNDLLGQPRDYVLPDQPRGRSQVLEAEANRAPGDDTLIAVAQRTQTDADSPPNEEAYWRGAVAMDAVTAGDASPSSAQLEAIHMASLRRAMRGMTRHSVHQAAERFIRLRDYARAVVAKTRALAQAVFDGYAIRFMRDQQQERER